MHEPDPTRRETGELIDSIEADITRLIHLQERLGELAVDGLTLDERRRLYLVHGALQRVMRAAQEASDHAPRLTDTGEMVPDDLELTTEELYGRLIDPAFTPIKSERYAVETGLTRVPVEITGDRTLRVAGREITLTPQQVYIINRMLLNDRRSVTIQLLDATMAQPGESVTATHMRLRKIMHDLWVALGSSIMNRKHGAERQFIYSLVMHIQLVDLRPANTVSREADAKDGPVDEDTQVEENTAVTEEGSEAAPEDPAREADPPALADDIEDGDAIEDAAEEPAQEARLEGEDTMQVEETIVPPEPPQPPAAPPLHKAARPPGLKRARAPELIPVEWQRAAAMKERLPKETEWQGAAYIVAQVNLPAYMVNAFIEHNRHHLGNEFPQSRKPDADYRYERFSPGFIKWAIDSLEAAKRKQP